MEYIIFLISMSALIYGANHIITESERVALKFGISHFVIGATLIGLGTSLPEIAASVSAAMQNKDDMAVANIVGSISFNITLVLGVCFLVASSIMPKRDIFAKDTAWLLFPFVAFILMAYDGKIDFFDGIILIALMGGYLLFLKNDNCDLGEEVDENLANEFVWYKSLFWLLLGFTLVVIGANFCIQSGSTIALNLGVSEWIVALLLIAFGTSLPELVVSVVAAKKGNGDMIIGNIIGSNIANITVAIGISALFGGLSIDLNRYGFDILLAGCATIMLVFICANRLYNRSASVGLLAIFAIMMLNSLKSIV